MKQLISTEPKGKNKKNKIEVAQSKQKHMETKTTESRDPELTTIPRGTSSLCNLKFRISDENLKLEKKKRKRGSKTSEISTEEQNTDMGESIKLSDMITVMKEAIKDKDVSACLISQFREDCKSMIEVSKLEIIEEIDEKIEGKMKIIEERDSAQDERITALEKRAETSEQEMRNNNLIVRGMVTTEGQTEEELIKYIATTLSRKLEMKIIPNDIRYAVKLGRVTNTNSLVKVVFHERRARDYIFRKRSLLKGSNIWLGEDLTVKHSKLAYQARQSAKIKEAYKTWTFEGHIFFKMIDNAEPLQIVDVMDLPTA